MKLKVCGMKFKDNMEEVAALGPDYMGFIFYRGSKRFFEGILPELDDSIRKMGVFVNEELSEVVRKANDYKLQGVQLHGDEDVTYCRALRKELAEKATETELIKVFSVGDTLPMKELESYQGLCDYFLFDTLGKERGGTGMKFNWNALADYDLSTPYLLSGGIGPDDAEALIRFFRTPSARACIGVDVNSKFEDSPGVKNIEKLKRFIEDIKEIRP